MPLLSRVAELTPLASFGVIVGTVSVPSFGQMRTPVTMTSSSVPTAVVAPLVETLLEPTELVVAEFVVGVEQPVANEIVELMEEFVQQEMPNKVRES